ncbi:hypothetical protein HMPREF9081_1493 [Centipeda periodontii DSM 2778]|uniref:Uncharacterized protein n=1 Tax=Centipeda periodontii DSM 2778 TaxID=888060 RepID=F5RMK7_9FIRM|nr:hypothetical protein [Centipeda periodontii]EGK59505.1 hypothetical protein HMPREF9081_1493 [Centipeda periodontii DSM 2778]
MQRRIEDYADIIDLPRPISRSHPPMSLRDRAGQFAPFSALTGLHAAAGRTEEERATQYKEYSPPEHTA